MRPIVGETWRDDMGQKWVIVGFEPAGPACSEFVLVKDYRQTKKSLARSAGGYPVAPSDFKNWTRT